MKCMIAEISGHNRDPVLSIDFKDFKPRERGTKQVYYIDMCSESEEPDSYVLCLVE